MHRIIIHTNLSLKLVALVVLALSIGQFLRIERSIYMFNLFNVRRNYTPLVYGFYHIFTSYNLHDDIVQEQIIHLKSSGTYDMLEFVKYTVIGKSDYNINDTKFVHEKYLPEGHEDITLLKLYEFCLQHPRDFVLYYHPKGSFSEAGSEKSYKNRYFRYMLNFYALNKKCYYALMNGYDVCGARLSPLPYLHYTGNFWWARCSYVNTLIDPRKMTIGSQLQNLSSQTFATTFPHCLGLDRFFSEAWIASGPVFNAADCIGDNSDYMNGYDLPTSIMSIVSNASTCPTCYENKIKCSQAAFNRSNTFRSKINHRLYDLYWSNYKDMFLSCCCGLLEQSIERGNLWYGNDSKHVSLLKLREKYNDYIGVNLTLRFGTSINYDYCLPNGGFTTTEWINGGH
eukprot:gene7308-9955_t